jgi:putative ABC transport system substrate-binding protein
MVQQVRASPIPIVFGIGGDPVGMGLVASINRPGGNATGVDTLVSELSGKQLGLLRDLVPKAATIAALQHVPAGLNRDSQGVEDARV